jgi:hypothetical protein
MSHDFAASYHKELNLLRQSAHLKRMYITPFTKLRMYIQRLSIQSVPLHAIHPFHKP